MSNCYLHAEGCKRPAYAEVETSNGWLKVCERHFRSWWDTGFRVRKAQPLSP